MIAELLQSLAQNTFVKLGALILFVIGVVFVVFNVFFQESVEMRSFHLLETHLTHNKNFGYLRNDNIYAYNGIAFYKINLAENNDTTVLYRNRKLPQPEAVYWANDSGVLLSFRESFLLSRVESELDERGLELNEDTERYTWFLDFENGELELVHQDPIEPGLVVYSRDKPGFYYVPDTFTGGEIATELSKPIRFYNIQTDQSTRISNALEDSISHLDECSELNFRVCFIAKNNNNPTETAIYGVDSEGQKTKIVQISGDIYPTNAPATFVMMHGKNTEARQTRQGHGVGADELPVSIFDATKDTRTDTGFTMDSGSSVLTYFRENDMFYMLENPLLAGDDYTEYRAAQRTDSDEIITGTRNLTYADNTPFTGNVLDTVSYGSNGVSLLTTYSNSQLLFAPAGSFERINVLDRERAENIVTSCSEPHAQEDEYYEENRLFRVFFTYNDQFSKNVRAFSECLRNTDQSVLVGYNFYIGALDPVNGRVISN